MLLIFQFTLSFKTLSRAMTKSKREALKNLKQRLSDRPETISRRAENGGLKKLFEESIKKGNNSHKVTKLLTELIFIINKLN